MSKALRVLVVEDIPADVDLIRLELRRCGLEFHCVTVQSRNQFIQELERNPPDVILSDHGLPGFDGYAALTIARETRPSVPFLFVTGARVLPTPAHPRWKADGEVPKTNLHQLVPAIQRALSRASRGQGCDTLCPGYKKEEIGPLVAALAHDIVQQGRRLEKQLAEWEDQQQAATDIPLLLENARNLQKLTEQLFLLTGTYPAGTGFPAPKLDSIIKSAMLQCLQNSPGRRINWIIRPLPAVQAHPVLLLLVVESLIEVALEVTRKQNLASLEIGASTSTGETLVWVEYQGGTGTCPFETPRDHLQGLPQPAVDFTEMSAPAILARGLSRQMAGRTWAEPRMDGGGRLVCAFPNTSHQPGPVQEPSWLPG